MKEFRERWLLYEEKAYGEGYRLVGGVDEAGRGPIAGPLVASAVILPKGVEILGIDDSKRLSPSRRKALYEEITKVAISWGVGIVDHEYIDKTSILKATQKAILLALKALDPSPDFILVDGTFIVDCPIPQISIKKGDSISQSIAAASIISKVTRDRLMEKYDLEYPQYGFARHKGYPTPSHYEAILRYGLCEIHRRSFKYKGHSLSSI
jgi:ribonuclease HII